MIRLRNKIVILVALTICVVSSLAIFVGCKKKHQPEDTQQAVSTERINLRILYAGPPSSDRAKDFADFLTKHFKQVKTTDYNTFAEDQTADFDVTILDYDGVDTSAPRPNIPHEYSRATVTMGVPGADICSSLSLKTGYL